MQQTVAYHRHQSQPKDTQFPETEEWETIELLITRLRYKVDGVKNKLCMADTGTKAGSVVFSLPVTDTAGMRLMEEIEGE